MSAFVVCRQLVKAFQVGNHEIVALRGIDFEMERGEMVTIIGPSGAGKSTMLSLLGGLDKPTAGQLMVDGQNLLELRGQRLSDYRLRQVGFLWQQTSRNLLAHRSALHNVTLPMMLAGVPVRERRKRAQELLDTVGVPEHTNGHLAQLSGGQLQRVAVAVALANRPNLLLADEPTGSLDHANAIQIMELVRDLRQQYGLTVLMVTHNIEIAHYADRVLTLRDGALGQDLSQEAATRPALDDEGRIQLPNTVRTQLSTAASIAIEIRPEGVLLRPEISEIDDTDALLQDMMPQDAPPQRRSAMRRLFGRWRRGKRLARTETGA
ncbi:MAG TPA: ABC transporter ATP-binding protein [Aggregatilineaceae bacterium]|nr:ABC transporter ATP-binding protein [Aggregatilineaceae bacterium]